MPDYGVDMVSKSPASHDMNLLEHAERLRKIALARLLDQEPDRTDRLCLTAPHLRLDLSRERIDESAWRALLGWTDAAELDGQRSAMLRGEPINRSESRPVLHMALRWPEQTAAPFPPEIMRQTRSDRARARAFAADLREGRAAAADGAPIEAIVHLGIGGSDLGPRLIAEALGPFADGRLILRTAANVDPADLATAIQGLNPARTLVFVVSKSFTTEETLSNAAAARAWLLSAVPASGLSRHLAAATAARARALAWGAPQEAIFPMPEGVGGRYSLWSAVSLSVEAWLAEGLFDRLLAGAAAMDRHFVETPPERNAPIAAGLARLFARIGFAARATATIPYAHRLRLLPAWLQQLEMESNGKGVDHQGRALAQSGASIIFGEPGTLAQHSFFQMLHQGLEPIPVEFIIARDHGDAPREAVRKLNAHALAQAKALLVGRRTEDQDPALAAQRACLGDRPSTLIGMNDLSPEAIGALLAFYEHRTFVEGAMQGLNSFDQWGVELGKALASGIEAELAGAPASSGHDSATKAWIEWLR